MNISQQQQYHVIRSMIKANSGFENTQKRTFRLRRDTWGERQEDPLEEGHMS